jgi:hypothetical protein
MGFFTNQKTWFFIALFFIVVNCVMLGGFFIHRKHRKEERQNYHGRQRKEFMHHRSGGFHATLIADTLGFTAAQKTELEKKESELNAKKDSIFSESEQSKQNFANELFSDNPDKLKLDSITKVISATTEQFNKLRIEKIFMVRAMCNPEQLKKFNSLMREIQKQHQHGPHAFTSACKNFNLL